MYIRVHVDICEYKELCKKTNSFVATKTHLSMTYESGIFLTPQWKQMSNAFQAFSLSVSISDTDHSCKGTYSSRNIKQFTQTNHSSSFIPGK